MVEYIIQTFPPLLNSLKIKKAIWRVEGMYSKIKKSDEDDDRVQEEEALYSRPLLP